MDPQVVRDQHTPPNLQTNPDQKTTFDQKNSTPEMQSTPDKQKTVEQQTTLAQEPKSDEDIFPDQQITPEGNEAYLRQHQRHLKNAYPSCDLSEVSYHTEHTGFPGSRHSSLNTEPLTLDADQMHDAKDQAVDMMQHIDTAAAFDVFTKDTLKTIIGRVSMMEYFWRHGQDVQVKTDEGLAQESEAQALAETKGPENSTTSLENDVKLKND